MRQANRPDRFESLRPDERWANILPIWRLWGGMQTLPFAKYVRRTAQEREADLAASLLLDTASDDPNKAAEGKFLRAWMQAHADSKHPIVELLLERILDLLAAGLVGTDESGELARVLKLVSDDPACLEWFAGGPRLPVAPHISAMWPPRYPLPNMEFSNKRFEFFGTFAFGTRKKCVAAVEGLGGMLNERSMKWVDYVVIGAFVPDCWGSEPFAPVLRHRMAVLDNDVFIPEQVWLEQAGLA